MYLLGLGVAHYLGYDIEPSAVLPGLVWLAALQLAGHYLAEAFDRVGGPGGAGALAAPGRAMRGARRTALLAGLSALAVASLAAYVLLLGPQRSAGLLASMALMAGAALLYGLPPARLRDSGYGELVVAAGFGNLVPLFAFLAAAGEADRLVAIVGLPLTFLILAMTLALELRSYAKDQRQGRRNLMARLGWETAMGLHNNLLLLAFLWLGAAVWMGLPAAIALPAFLPLPLVVLQIAYMRRIAQGGKPNWPALALNAVTIAGGCAYLLGIGFWTR